MDQFRVKHIVNEKETRRGEPVTSETWQRAINLSNRLVYDKFNVVASQMRDITFSAGGATNLGSLDESRAWWAAKSGSDFDAGYESLIHNAVLTLPNDYLPGSDFKTQGPGAGQIIDEQTNGYLHLAFLLTKATALVRVRKVSWAWVVKDGGGNWINRFILSPESDWSTTTISSPDNVNFALKKGSVLLPGELEAGDDYQIQVMFRPVEMDENSWCGGFVIAEPPLYRA